jgi:octaprenyl-diphosphate synthase
MDTTPSVAAVADPYVSAQQLFAGIAHEMALVEEELERQADSAVPLIETVGRHLRLSRGKRVRPALTLLSTAAAGGDAARPNVVRLAAVMELLHTATLVHDDIIDNAETRRNRPSINSRFGNQTAVLMGDWLYMSAFEASLRERSLPVLDILTAVTRKMVEGELIQFETKGRADITEAEYFDILRRKTAHLLSACCEIGAMLGRADARQQEALRDYGLSLGVAFQLVDDLLDFTSLDEAMGKPTGADLPEGKVTLPLIYLLEGDPSWADAVRAVMRDGGYEAVTRQELLRAIERRGALGRAAERAHEYAAAACRALEALPPSPSREVLQAMPAYILGRDH